MVAGALLMLAGVQPALVMFAVAMLAQEIYAEA